MASNRLKVNISTPDSWDFDRVLRLHSPSQSKAWEEFQFYHNQTQGTFDFWIILEDLERPTSIKVTRGNVFFVTMEEAAVVPSYLPGYLGQFDQVITSRADLSNDNVINSHYFVKWHINKSYDELLSTLNGPMEKTRDLSAIISSRVQYGQQKVRYAFINKLKGHFKAGLDWYCREENPVTDKWQGLAPYKFSIAIENSAHRGYFTEKVVDVVLSEAIPIYWGAPNILDYFPKDVMVNIPLNDFLKSIEIIEDAMQTKTYPDAIPSLKDCKRKILQEYQFLPWLANLLRVHQSGSSAQATKRLYGKTEVSLKVRARKKLYSLFLHGR